VGNNTPAKRRGKAVTTKDESVSFEPKNAEELRRFFEANKNRYHEIWVVLTNKKYANPQPVSFNEAVAEAVKQGLVDSRTKTLSEQKYSIRFTKRRDRNPRKAIMIPTSHETLEPVGHQS
jgi:hypothetical protein